MCAEVVGTAANLGPDIPFPMCNRSFISLRRATFRFLTTPVHGTQDFPNMPGMVLDLKSFFEETRNPPQGPQIGLVARGEWTFEQVLFQLLFLLGGQTGRTTWDRFSLQPCPAFALESLLPPDDGTASRTHSPCDGGWKLTRLPHLNGKFTTFF